MGKYFIKTPVLNSYLYDICYNLDDETIRKLPFKYRKILRATVATKNFCERSTIDEKIHFMHHLNLRYAITVFPEKIKGKNKVKEFFKNYEEGLLSKAQKDQAELNVYVSTDKETAFLMGLMAQTISDKGFILNLDYNKLAYHIKNWDKQLNTPDANEFNDTVESTNIISNTILHSLMDVSKSDILFGVSPIDMKMLFLFFTKRNRYISKEIIWESFMTTPITKGKVTSSIKRLLLNEYIYKNIDWRNQTYTIGAKGINVVYEFLTRILKKNEF